MKRIAWSLSPLQVPCSWIQDLTLRIWPIERSWGSGFERKCWYRGATQVWANVQEINVDWERMDIFPTSACKNHLNLVLQGLQKMWWYIDTLRVTARREFTWCKQQYYHGVETSPYLVGSRSQSAVSLWATDLYKSTKGEDLEMTGNELMWGPSQDSKNE